MLQITITVVSRIHNIPAAEHPAAIFDRDKRFNLFGVNALIKYDFLCGQQRCSVHIVEFDIIMIDLIFRCDRQIGSYIAVSVTPAREGIASSCRSGGFGRGITVSNCLHRKNCAVIVLKRNG